MATIKITPEELEQGASTIKGQEDQILGLLRQLNNTIQGVAANWEGAAQNAFLNQFNELYNKTLTGEFPQILEGLQSQLKEAARIMRETDQALQKALGGGR